MCGMRSIGPILAVVASLLTAGAQTFVTDYAGELDVSIPQTVGSANGGSFAVVSLRKPSGGFEKLIT